MLVNMYVYVYMHIYIYISHSIHCSQKVVDLISYDLLWRYTSGERTSGLESIKLDLLRKSGKARTLPPKVIQNPQILWEKWWSSHCPVPRYQPQNPRRGHLVGRSFVAVRCSNSNGCHFSGYHLPAVFIIYHTIFVYVWPEQNNGRRCEKNYPLSTLTQRWKNHHRHSKISMKSMVMFHSYASHYQRVPSKRG